MGVVPVEFKKPKFDEEAWIKIQKVCRAIVTIHAEGRYYEGMDLLCDVVGWPHLMRSMNLPEEMDVWIKQQRGTVPEVEAPLQPIVPKPTGGKCPECRRIRISNNTPPEKRRKSRLPVCNTCGRRFNKSKEDL